SSYLCLPHTSHYLPTRRSSSLPRTPPTATSTPPLITPVTRPCTSCPSLSACSSFGFVSSSRSGLRVSTTRPPRDPSLCTRATSRDLKSTRLNSSHVKISYDVL